MVNRSSIVLVFHLFCSVVCTKRSPVKPSKNVYFSVHCDSSWSSMYLLKSWHSVKSSILSIRTACFCSSVVHRSGIKSCWKSMISGACSPVTKASSNLIRRSFSNSCTVVWLSRLSRVKRSFKTWVSILWQSSRCGS